MPLSDLQRDILRTLTAQRNPESYIAGSTPLHRDGPRFSGDIDIFHHREEDYAELGGKRHGVWPSSSDISSAMLDRYR